MGGLVAAYLVVAYLVVAYLVVACLVVGLAAVPPVVACLEVGLGAAGLRAAFAAASLTELPAAPRGAAY